MSEVVEKKEKISEVISEIYTKIPAEGITLEDFLNITGDNGLFMSCMILTAPFLLPVSIPGMGIPFGSAIFLISSDIILNRPVLIPKRVMDHKMSKKDIESLLNGILHILKPLEEKIVNQRLCFLTRNRKMIYLNGAAMAFGAILLITPMIAIAANFFPSYGILFLSLGNLENDGYLVLAGYVAVIFTAIYYILIFALSIGLIILILSYLVIHL
jgi:hypothetical protein